MTEFLTRRRVAAACAMLAVALSATTTATAQAQRQADAPRPTGPALRGDPMDARVDVPRLTYRSPMQGYRPYADVEPASWIDANRTVGQVGGWRAYAKEAREPEAPKAAGAPASAALPGVKGDMKTDAPQPRPTGHEGHKLH